MASDNLDDLMPRPLPKPLQLEEVCSKPEVPEVSLVFDSLPVNSANYSPLPAHQNAIIQQQMNALSLNKNHFLRDQREPRYSLLPSSNSPPHSPVNGFSRTPNKVENQSFHVPKKVTFSHHSSKNEETNCQQDGVEMFQTEPENTNCPCNHDRTTISKFSASRSAPDGKRSSCLCMSCTLDNFDSPPEQINSGVVRLLKNLERKINAKVSFDDLQKTELKIENILLKHKCKYDKLGENCVTKDEFNRVIQKYENQINLLQLRLEELTKKISYSPANAGVLCGHSNAKCVCSNGPNNCQRNASSQPITNPLKCSSHDCCSQHAISNSNGKYFQEMYRKFDNEEALIPCSDRVVHKQTQVSMQVATSDKHDLDKHVCQKICCRNHETFKSPDHCELKRERETVFENHGQSAHNVCSSPKQCSNEPRHVPKSDANGQPVEHRSPSRNFSHSYHQPHLQENRSDNQAMKASEKNVRLDWTLYNNIVEDVKNFIQQNPAGMDRNSDSAEFIKKATMEQLQKIGINIDSNSQDEKHPQDDHCQKNKFIPGNSAPSPDMGFRLNSLAMKYVSDVPPNGDYYGKKSSVNDISLRSNCNNVSIATLQYMERYQLLPNTDQRHGGNAGDFNKFEQNISQEHRHTSYKQTQNNDRSFIC